MDEDVLKHPSLYLRPKYRLLPKRSGGLFTNDPYTRPGSYNQGPFYLKRSGGLFEDQNHMSYGPYNRGPFQHYK